MTKHYIDYLEDVPDDIKGKVGCIKSSLREIEDLTEMESTETFIKRRLAELKSRVRSMSSDVDMQLQRWFTAEEIREAKKKESEQ